MTGLEDLPLREDLRGQEPYGAPQLEVPVRLNTNENPHAPSPELAAEIGAAVTSAALGLNRYPDREAVALRRALAGYLSTRTGGRPPVGPEQVWAANGSNEVLQQLLQAFGGPGRSALGFEPSYSMHRIIAAGASTRWVAGTRQAAMFTLTAEHAVAQVRATGPDITFLCSPNNPTGTALELDVVEAVHDATTGMVVVDEAYCEFSDRPSALSLLPGRPRLVVVRTMSKAFALAGARVGYLAADPAVVDALRLVRLPYHLSVLTQAAALAAIQRSAELLRTVELVKAQRDRIVAELRARRLDVVDSDANFVLFGRFADSAAVWSGLLERGVLVRDVGLPGWLRVSAGTEDEVTAFLSALDQVDVRVAPHAGVRHAAAPAVAVPSVEERTA
jgi:histidinol-phosphate aminotransferase